ncbi:hypothetical protein R84865_002491 [Carnimonas sp. R-84865]
MIFSWHRRVTNAATISLVSNTRKKPRGDDPHGVLYGMPLQELRDCVQLHTRIGTYHSYHIGKCCHATLRRTRLTPR